MDVNNILITSIKENKMPHEFSDIEYIKKNSDDKFSTTNNNVFVIYRNGYKLEISYYKTPIKLHYVSFEKIDDKVEDFFLDNNIDTVNKNLKAIFNKTLQVSKNKNYYLGNFEFIFNDSLLESIFYTPN